MIEATLADGRTLMPGIGSDIADPDAHEIAYEGTPLRPLVSFARRRRRLSERYGELTVPLLLFTSKQDHVVDPAPERVPGRALRGRRRPPVAGPQLPRRDAGLRPRPDLHRDGRLRPTRVTDA